MRREDEINYSDVYNWLRAYKAAKAPQIKSQLQNLIVIACMPLVKKISCGLARRSTDPVEDLMQVGCVGLLKAVESFDSERTTLFRPYAAQLVTGEIRHYLRDKGNIIKAPREIQQLAFRMAQISQSIQDETGRKPTDIELAQRLDIDLGRVFEVIDIERRKNIVSLDQLHYISDDDCATLYERIPDEKELDNKNIYEIRDMIKKALAKLTPELRHLIELHFFEEMSQAEIAQNMNVSQMHISRKIRQALKNLFNIISDGEYGDIANNELI